MYYVSLQTYWHDPEGRRCVEIGSGEPGPGMLAEQDDVYLETQHFWVAARHALDVADGRPITAANSMVYGDPDDPYDPDELRAQADKLESEAPRCEGCGEIPESGELAEWTDYEQDISFTVCDESCFERAYRNAYPYVVHCGLRGGYLPNTSYPCIDWSDARRTAVEEARRWQEHSSDLPEDDRPEEDVYYSGDRETFTFTQGYESIEAYRI